MNRALLALFALAVALAVGCAAPGAPDEGTEENADELRALKPGDIDSPLLKGIPAVSPPRALADIASWDLDYVNMMDPVPANSFNGIILFARDKEGRARYMLPTAATDSVFELFIFEVAPNGTPVSARFKPSETNDAATALLEVQNIIEWIQSERTRLRDLLRVRQKDQFHCLVDLAMFALVVDLPLFFLAQAGEELIFGDVGQSLTSGSIGGAAYGAVKAGWASLKRLGQGAVVVFAGVVLYGGYQEGYKGIVKSVVPESCQRTLELFPTPPADAFTKD